MKFGVICLCNNPDVDSGKEEAAFMKKIAFVAGLLLCLTLVITACSGKFQQSLISGINTLTAPPRTLTQTLPKQQEPSEQMELRQYQDNILFTA